MTVPQVITIRPSPDYPGTLVVPKCKACDRQARLTKVLRTHRMYCCRTCVLTQGHRHSLACDQAWKNIVVVNEN